MINKYRNYGKVSGFLATLLFFANSCEASGVPDEIIIRNITLNPATDLTFSKPNHLAATKALRNAGCLENLDSAYPKSGGFADAYLAPSFVVRISRSGYSVNPSGDQELMNLIALKNSVKKTPLAGLTLCLPKVLFNPYLSDGYANPCPYNIYVSTRLKPVKEMEDVIRDALIYNSPYNFNIINSFGARLSQMQANSIRKAYTANYSGYVADGHMDLNCRNILLMAMPTFGVPAAFSLIDNADFKRGAAYDKPIPVEVDVFYFLLKNMFVISGNNAYQNLSQIEKKQRMQTYYTNFFVGYLSEFSANVRSELKPIYTSMEALNIYNKHTKYIAQPFNGNYSDIALPAICAAFHYYEIPAQVPVLPADYTTEIYLSLNFDLFAAFSGLDPNQRDIEAKNHYRDNGRKEGRRYLPVNAQFDAATYLRLNPGLTAAVAAFTFPIDRKNWAEAHYLYFGHNELRLFMDVPAGFDPLKYLYMNRDLLLAPDIDTPARKCSFAQIHYVNNGRGEGRLYTDVAVNFEPLRYLDLHPDLNAAAAPMSVAHRKVFAYEHFYSSGKNELRKYLNTPAGFNPLRYLSLHPDLSNATDRMTDSDKYAYGQEHYVNYGRAENRAY